MSNLVTLEEIAEMANVPVATVKYWRQHNSTDIKFARVGKKLMARRSDVQRWLDSLFV